MSKTAYSMGVVLLIVAFSGGAFAELIDFRAAAWSAAATQQSYTLDGVTVTCNPDNNSSNTDVLFWDAIDGLGVTSGPDEPTDSPDGEADEINWYEYFQIYFDSPTVVNGVWVADLYQYDDPGTGEWVDWPVYDPDTHIPHDGSGSLLGEQGSVRVDSVTEFEFLGDDSEQVNGTQYVSLNMVATTLDFTTICSNSDYSVIGVDVVPLPGAVLLGFLGLGFAGMRLRRMVA